MIKRFVFICLLALISYSAVFSQLSRMRRDGLWWPALDVQKKINYILGYTKGIYIGSGVVLDKYPKGSKCLRKGTSALNNLSKKLDSLTIEDAINRIDSLYRVDSTNTGLMVFHAYWLVVNQVSGMPVEDLNQMYYYYRREDCDRFKTLQELKDYQLSY